MINLIRIKLLLSSLRLYSLYLVLGDFEVLLLCELPLHSSQLLTLGSVDHKKYPLGTLLNVLVRNLKHCLEVLVIQDSPEYSIHQENRAGSQSKRVVLD